MAEEFPADHKDKIIIEKVTVDDTGTRLLVMVQTSRKVEAFVFERNDPPSLFIQFMSSNVYSGADPLQVVGIDPLKEIRYGYRNFKDATTNREPADNVTCCWDKAGGARHRRISAMEPTRTATEMTLCICIFYS